MFRLLRTEGNSWLDGKKLFCPEARLHSLLEAPSLKNSELHVFTMTHP